MKRLCDIYIRRAGQIGALYCAVPTVAWFAGMFIVLPFREVYVLRAVLSLIIGCSIGAYINRFGMSLWLMKHRSKEGPATAFDGTLVGAAIGFGIAFLPTLTSLIGTNHPEQAKTFIIISTAGAAIIGGCFGGTLGTIGRKNLASGEEELQEE